MAQLSMYKDLENKRKAFDNRNENFYQINSVIEIDKWLEFINADDIKGDQRNSTNWIYRGVPEAKYKLLTSAQRLWQRYNVNEWSSPNISFLDFIQNIVVSARKHPVIKEVLKLYDFGDEDIVMPILSLFQHYGAATPLMDWTYSCNIALFFATNELRMPENSTSDIDNYFSVYRISKEANKELINLNSFINGMDTIEFFKQLKGLVEANPTGNTIFYISDFESPRFSSYNFNLEGQGELIREERPNLRIRTIQPYTTLYNQNIIPQQGLFIFNPYYDQHLENIFKPTDQAQKNLKLSGLECFNIHKDLGNYLRRKLEKWYDINKSFIFPNMNNIVTGINEQTLNSIIPHKSG